MAEGSFWGEGEGGSKKKVAGQTPLAWGLEIVGALGLLLLVRSLRGRRAAAGGASSATGALGGGTIPPVSFTTPGTKSATTTAPITTLTEWLDRFLTTATTTHYTPGQAYNDFQNWQGGKCVSAAGFTALSQAFTTLGLPPNAVDFPLSVCKTSGTKTTNPPTTTGTKQQPPSPPFVTPGGAPQTPNVPALSASLAALLAPGENVVGSQFDKATNTFLYLTNLGGVYTVNATTGQATSRGFFGSYLGLPAAGRQGVRSFTDIIANPDGSYTLIANDGSRYLFGPNAQSGETNLVGAG